MVWRGRVCWLSILGGVKARCFSCTSHQGEDIGVYYTWRVFGGRFGAHVYLPIQSRFDTDE
jgi:hypothetical protein